MWLAMPLPSFRPAVRPAQTQTRAAVTSAAFLGERDVVVGRHRPQQCLQLALTASKM